MKSSPRCSPVFSAAAISILIAIPAVHAAQEVAAPEAHAWIDIATFSGMGMPMGGMSGMGAIGGLLGAGGGSDSNS
ncbi:MAG: hypothetical protein K9J43_05885, partial [Polynucleobacter sp.]|nr:hypothetical protein [Polynucleobacter sp.]